MSVNRVCSRIPTSTTADVHILGHVLSYNMDMGQLFSGESCLRMKAQEESVWVRVCQGVGEWAGVRGWCCFFSCSLFPFLSLADSKKRSLSASTPIKTTTAARLCPAGSSRCSQSMWISLVQKKKKNAAAAVAARDYFWKAGAGFSLLPVHERQHNIYTALLLLWFASLSKYLGTKSECFLGTVQTQTGVWA